MSLEPMAPRDARSDLVQRSQAEYQEALQAANQLLAAYRKDSRIFEGAVRREVREAVFENKFRALLERLHAANLAILSHERLYYSELLMEDLLQRTQRVCGLLESFGTSSNVFAQAAATRLFELWMDGTGRLLQQHGF